ncbi:unnamed protein product [Timema podura]|uniref:Uncharacterized protein n=1 Tax=Timema podura TaxID=61482 RepID=A0ABN7PHL6_TIMPD|nr:unnamed protein product [Timema podura]
MHMCKNSIMLKEEETRSHYTCYWCPHANRCSNGLDRLRQDWLTRGCDTSALDTSEQCPAIEEINKSVNAGHTRSPQQVIVNDRTKSGHIPGILAITIILAVCGALGLWIMYAYRNPHTASGQFLIRVMSLKSLLSLFAVEH